MSCFVEPPVQIKKHIQFTIIETQEKQQILSLQKLKNKNDYNIYLRTATGNLFKSNEKYFLVTDNPYKKTFDIQLQKVITLQQNQNKI